jgi:hypothetical protein
MCSHDSFIEPNRALLAESVLADNVLGVLAVRMAMRTRHKDLLPALNRMAVGSADELQYRAAQRLYLLSEVTQRPLAIRLALVAVSGLEPGCGHDSRFF